MTATKFFSVHGKTKIRILPDLIDEMLMMSASFS